MLRSVAITAITFGGLNVRLVLRREIEDEHEGESVCVFMQVLESLAHLIGTSFKIHTV